MSARRTGTAFDQAPVISVLEAKDATCAAAYTLLHAACGLGTMLNTRGATKDTLAPNSAQYQEPTPLACTPNST